jgi:2-polyprenyl-3-methyl-5-hydroxy-6-metoxy-1,4-benzoquinol methylase
MNIAHWYDKDKYAEQSINKEQQLDFVQRCGYGYLKATQDHIREDRQGWINGFLSEDTSADGRCWIEIKKNLVKTGMTMLDVGSNVGYHVFRARNEGILASGIEPSLIMVQWINKFKKTLESKFRNIEFICGTTEIAYERYGKKSFDIIYSKHVYEHVINPIKTMMLWKEMAKVGVCGVVPNNENKTFFQAYEEHLWRFSPKVIIKIMEYCGFKNIGTCVFKDIHDNTEKLGFWGDV